MKTIRMKIAAFVAVSILALAGIALGNSVEPPPNLVNKAGKIKIIQAHFEATKCKQGTGYECEVQAFLTMPKKDTMGNDTVTHKFFSCKLVGDISKRAFCEYTKTQLLNEFLKKCADFSNIPKKFGLSGVAHIMEFKVPNLADNCDEVTDDISPALSGTVKILVIEE